ncbi:hypothetical protein B0T21DRAFT_383784 [Apiosordaria backusii]|uniref:RNA ligase domain-containing protein n=1 Tax=Apiosordaria backusii TaxID=314023 RepID=A0AA40EHK5_9PEZI|nr:hypothetical protein B0T21DRAFT_383784 [Apiosordaria backusii]
MSSHRSFLEAAIMDSQATLPSEATGSNTVATMPVPPRHIRKLATIRRISALEQINKRWDVATIDGWRILVLLDEGFMPNELVLFCEVDSFLPHRNPYSSLFKPFGTLQTLEGEEGWRIATQTLEVPRHWDSDKPHKFVSQGRIFHLTAFPTIVRDLRSLRLQASNSSHTSFEEFIRNVDFSDTLGIKKWAPMSTTPVTRSALVTSSVPATPSAPTSSRVTPIPSSSSGRGPLQNPKTPPFIPSARMERVQNCPNLFIKHKYRRYVYQQSVKLDGSAMTVYFVKEGSHLYDQLPLLNNQVAQAYLDNCVFDNGRAGICSSGRDIVYAVQSLQPFVSTAIGLRLPQLLSKLGLNIAIQGELIGHNILGNPYGYTAPNKKASAKDKLGDCGNGFDFFLYSIVDIHTGKRWNPKAVSQFAVEHGLRHVPIEGYVRIREIANSHDELQALADATPGEGLVFKCLDDGRWFKVLSTKWILEKGDEALARGERLRQMTAVEVESPTADLADKKPEPMQPTAPQTYHALTTIKQTTIAAPPTAPVSVPTAFVSAPSTSASAATTSVPVPKPTSEINVPVTEALSKPAIKEEVPVAETMPKPTPVAPAFTTTAPSGVPYESPNQDLWDRNADRLIHFMDWASGNDWKNIMDFVEAHSAKRAADEALEKIKREMHAFLDEKVSEQARKQQGWDNNETPTQENKKTAAEDDKKKVSKENKKAVAEEEEKTAVEEDKKAVAEKQPATFSYDVKKKPSGFYLNCAAEDSDDEVSGVDENPEAEDDIDTSPSSATTVSTTTEKPMCSPPQKRVVVSKETISWLGF